MLQAARPGSAVCWCRACGTASASDLPYPHVQDFITNWLVGYSALLGPVLGVIMADYFIVRRRMLDINSLCAANILALM